MKLGEDYFFQTSRFHLYRTSPRSVFSSPPAKDNFVRRAEDCRKTTMKTLKPRKQNHQKSRAAELP
jgi:hypothetical protein